MRSEARTAAEVAVWTVACFAVWLATLSAVTWQDAALAAGGSAIAAACAVAARRRTGDSWRVRIGWCRWLAVLPVAVVADTAAVLATAYRLRPHAESRRSYRLPAHEDDATSAGRAALGSLTLSAVPSSYVEDTDREQHVLQVRTAGTIAPAWAQVNPTEP